MVEGEAQESKLGKVCILLIDGILSGAALAIGGFIAGASLDLYRGGRASKKRRGRANKSAPTIIRRYARK